MVKFADRRCARIAGAGRYGIDGWLSQQDGDDAPAQAYRVVSRFLAYDSDGTRALRDFARSRLSHRLSIMDVLIAQGAIGLNAALCTFNTKHFKAIAHLRTEQPYAKK
jgi:predicted nucleic acid-binding protein